MQHTGGCHCGAVKFVFDAPSQANVTHCSCSICNMTGYEHVFIPKVNFEIIKGADKLTIYTFNSHTAKHMFCRECGVKAFYIPRSHPECYSVNLRCIAPPTLKITEIFTFSGQDWEANINGLRVET